MSPVWMLQDAKNAFSEVVNRACSSGPQIVTRRGRPVAVVISYENYSEQKSRGESFVDFLGSAQLEDGELDLSRSRDVGRPQTAPDVHFLLR